MAEDRKGIKDPMKSGKDFGSPFDIFKAKLNKETLKNLKQPTGGLTSKKGKGVPDPKVKINRSTLKSLSANKTAVQKAKARAEAKAKSKAPKAGKPTNTKIGPNMSKVNKPAPKPGNKSNAPNPFNNKNKPNMAKVNKPTPKPAKAKAKKTGTQKPEAKKFDRMKAARNQMKSARASMGFKKGGRIDGCAKRGLTRAKRSR